jgi:excisionase family DNA binding protein
MAVGFGLAQEMIKQTGAPGAAGAGPAAAGAAPAATPTALLTPAQVAQELGVSEADVMASINEGKLKAKQIGTQYRIARAALDAFLAE